MTADFFAGNRRSLMQALGDDPLVIMTAHTAMQRNADAAFAFEQEANFWYLCGIEAADWQLIISQDQTYLVQPDIDDVRQIFDGSLAKEQAGEVSGIATILTSSESAALLPRLAKRHQTVHTLLPQTAMAERAGFALNPGQVYVTERLQGLFERVTDCRSELAKLRGIKQPQEIAALRHVAGLSAAAITDAVAQLPAMAREYEFEAAITHGFRRRGATGHAYDPIVAAGLNACTLHYTANDDVLRTGELLLFDVGARAGGYCADITRTVAIGGVMTERQQAVWEAVMRVHDMAVRLCVPGQGIAEYQDAVTAAMAGELVALGLISDAADENAVHRYFPHAISHGLGIDVHDPLGAPEKFAAGMVLTVEPGIYIPKEKIGIRLENDILITDNGPENLTGALADNLAI